MIHSFLDTEYKPNYANDRERERERERERDRQRQNDGQDKSSIVPLFKTGLKITQFLNAVYYLQLCVGDASPFPLVKPSRSFQNLTEKSALIILLLSKNRKNDHKKLKIG